MNTTLTERTESLHFPSARHLKFVGNSRLLLNKVCFCALAFIQIILEFERRLYKYDTSLFHILIIGFYIHNPSLLKLSLPFVRFLTTLVCILINTVQNAIS